MTEEQIAKLLETVQDFEKADKVSAIIVAIGIVFAICIVIFELWRYKAIKKMHKEYLATLTEEQAKELERNKRYL